ncbi:response regulator [Paenibacillus sp. GD4]|uniref:response regulator transcription factor n=1 Tax=Paenibacillus sp. GD4 TaxID=3068890 RepID=UPI002796E20D|nr:response regulator [Paenibacillus sp. GD4]MDQ1914147.1 response regulator [Paenibacillus sp. GD4]
MFKVLIADDERMVRLTLRTIIERDAENFVVIEEAKDGEQALQRSLELKPDLIVTDVRMPGLTGLELIRSLTDKQLTSEYVVVSGYGDFEYAQSALRFGVADYLLKPIDPSYFLSVLTKIHGKLQSRTSKQDLSKDWLWSWKVHAERAAKSIWHMNEGELAAELERIRSTMKPGPVPVKPEQLEQLTYYLIVLNGTLQEVSQNGLPLPKAQLPDNASLATAERLYDSLHACLMGLIEHIRLSRNWWSYNRMVKSAKEYIEEHYKKADLSLKDAAAHFALSPNYFGNMFKKETGVSFNQYVTQFRMEKAKAFLQNPFVKVYEAGEAVGYEDYAYFSKTFKKYTGFSPSDYRKYESIEVPDSI